MKRNNIFSSFLLFCSAVSKECLNSCPESEFNKYVCMGSIIFMTSIFAAFSSGYATFTVFGSKNISLCFAILWGFLILNLDRYIVSSMIKSGNIFREIAQATPRIILSIFIALIISRPLELKIFQDEITQALSNKLTHETQELSKEFDKKIEELKEKIKKETEYEKTNTKKIIATENIIIKDLEKIINDFKKKKNEAYYAFTCECDGTCSKKGPGDGPICKIKRRCYVDTKKEYERERLRLTQQINQKNVYIELLKTQLSEKLTKMEDKYDSKVNDLELEKTKLLFNKKNMFSYSLLNRHQMLWELSQNNFGIMLISVTITVLFMIIETAPVFVKLISKQSSYDLLLNYEVNETQTEILKKKIENKKKLQTIKINELNNTISLYEKKKLANVKKALVDSITPIEMEKIQQFLQDWKNKIASKQEYFDDFDTIFYNHIKEILNQNSSRENLKNLSEKKQNPEPAGHKKPKDQGRIIMFMGRLAFCLVSMFIYVFTMHITKGRIDTAIAAESAYFTVISTYFTVRTYENSRKKL